MGTYAPECYGLEIGKDVTLNIFEIVEHLRTNGYLFSDSNIDRDDFEGIHEIIDYLSLSNIQELIDILVKNTRGEGLIRYLDADSDNEWLVIETIFPRENSEYYGMTFDRTINLFLESIKHFIVEDKDLKSKMKYVDNYEIHKA